MNMKMHIKKKRKKHNFCLTFLYFCLPLFLSFARSISLSLSRPFISFVFLFWATLFHARFNVMQRGINMATKYQTTWASKQIKMVKSAQTKRTRCQNTYQLSEKKGPARWERGREERETEMENERSQSEMSIKYERIKHTCFLINLA